MTIKNQERRRHVRLEKQNRYKILLIWIVRNSSSRTVTVIRVFSRMPSVKGQFYASAAMPFFRPPPRKICPDLLRWGILMLYRSSILPFYFIIFVWKCQRKICVFLQSFYNIPYFTICLSFC